jgi:DNA-binding transcriptional MerR regulator
MALKEGKLFYSISEVSAHFDVTASLLRYWESEFLSIKPRRNPKGTRFYSSKDIDEIRKIYYLVKENGYTN